MKQKSNHLIFEFTATILLLFIVGIVCADEQIRPANQMPGRGVGEQIRPANQMNLPEHGNYNPTQGSDYSSGYSSEDNEGNNHNETENKTNSIVNFQAVLNNTNATNLSSNATGKGLFVLDNRTNTLSYNITYEDLSSNETGAYILGPFVPELNSTISFALSLGNEKIEALNYPKIIEDYIISGKTYVKILSLLFPEGEISGEIVKI